MLRDVPKVHRDNNAPGRLGTASARFWELVLSYGRFLFPSFSLISCRSHRLLGNPFIGKGYNFLMPVAVSLQNLIGELQMLPNEGSAYLNKVTRKVILLNESDFME